MPRSQHLPPHLNEDDAHFLASTGSSEEASSMALLAAIDRYYATADEYGVPARTQEASLDQIVGEITSAPEDRNEPWEKWRIDQMRGEVRGITRDVQRSVMPTGSGSPEPEPPRLHPTGHRRIPS
jgi:hypothetical protein